MKRIGNKLKNAVMVMALIFGLYAGLRMWVILAWAGSSTPTIVVISLAVAVIIMTFTSYIWRMQGLVFSTLVLSIFASDVVCGIIFFIFPAVGHNDVFLFLWINCIFALVVYAFNMLFGFLNTRSVKTKRISYTSKKLKNDKRVVFISDIHFNKSSVLPSEVELINKENPDVVIFGGDLADEKTSKKSFTKLFDLLGQIKAKDGKYFVHGDHDRQEMLQGHLRTYSDEEFDKALADADIKCFDNEIVNISDDFRIVGRPDLIFDSIKEFKDIFASDKSNAYTLVAEHTPTRHEAEGLTKYDVDLYLAGHYHGATYWPLNVLYKICGIMYMGPKQFDNLNVYVSKGFAVPMSPFRTHSYSDYLVIDLKAE